MSLNETYESQISVNQNLTFDRFDYDDDELRFLGILNEEKKFTNLGLLMSMQNTHNIRLAIYEGNNKSQLKGAVEFGGSLQRQIDDVTKYIGGELGRALKDAVIAALIQRDYSFKGELIINVFKDKVVIITLGALPDGFDVIRNERLANMFRRIRLTYSIDNIKLSKTEGAFLISVEKNILPSNKILAALEEKSELTRKEAESILGLRQTAAGKVLKELMDLGKIIQLAAGKNTKYIRKENGN